MTADTTAPDPTAVLVRRVIAYLIDLAIYAAAALVPLALLYDSRSTQVGESLDRVGRLGGEDPYFLRGDTVYFVTESDLLTAGLIALGVFLLLGVVMQGLTGRTVGKWVTGIRTIRPDGSKPGLGRAFVRELAWIVDALPYPTALVGGVLALVTTGRRRIGDLVGRTYVVHRRFAGTPIVHPDDAAAAEAAGEGADEDAAGAPEAVAVAAGAAAVGPEEEPATSAPESAAVAAGAGAVGPEEEPGPDTGAGSAVPDDHAAAEAAWAPTTAAAVDESGVADDADQAEAVGGATGADRDRPSDTVESGAVAPAAETGGGAEDEGGGPPAGGNEPSPPRWDPARRAYISYDPRRGEWLQHDDETGEWGPISRA